MSRVALVTGSSGGIGAAIGKRLESDGLDVLGVDLKAARDRDVSADLATPEGNRAAVDAALERFGRLDVIVAAAGFQHIASVAEFPEDRWEALLAVMLTSPFLLSKYAWPALTESPEARIIVIASAHGLVASPFKAGYVAAKHGAVGLVKVVGLEAPNTRSWRRPCVPGLSARRWSRVSSRTRQRPTTPHRSGCSRTWCWHRTRSSA